MKRLGIYLIFVLVIVTIAVIIIGCALIDSRTDEEKIREEVEAQMEETVAEIRQENVEKTKAKIEEYEKIGWFTLDIFMSIPPEAIGDDLIGYIEIFDDEKEQKLAFLEQQKTKQLDSVDTLLNSPLNTDYAIMTEDEAEELNESINKEYKELENTVISGYDNVITIIETAIKQERILTEAETAIIVKIKEEMRKDIIGSLEEYVSDNE